VYVLGNHEFYGYDVSIVLNGIYKILSQFNNIYILDNQNINIDGVNFWGATFWPNIPPQNRYKVQMSISDFNHIYVGNTRVSARNMEEWHSISLQSLKNFISSNLQNKVVVSHFCPSLNLVSPIYKNELAINTYYNHNLDSIILKSDIKLWFYGHTHITGDALVGNTRCIVNAAGYSDGDNPHFDNKKLIEI
jgi:hypothetical protein